MAEFFNWLSGVSISSIVFIIVVSVLALAAILIYLIAFLQGREISFWPPKIGQKPLQSKQSSPPLVKDEDEKKFLDRMDAAFQRIQEYVDAKSTEKITEIVDDTLEHVPPVWLKLLLIRMTLRRLLLKISEGHAIKFRSSTSIDNMTKTFLTSGIIDTFLADQIEKIRDATYTVEWGQGESPKPQNVRFTLEKYGDVFDALKKRMYSSK